MNRNSTRPVIFLSLVSLLSFWQSAGALTVRAEQANIKTVGGPAGEAWNLWSIGEWGDFVHFARTGTYQVRVLCFGSAVNNIWPEMGFSIDGAIVETVSVATNKATEYVFRLQTVAGDHRVELCFLNDAMTRTEDRNLFIVSMTIAPSTKAPDPTLASPDKWMSVQAKQQLGREKEILAKATKAIERGRKVGSKVCITDDDGRPVTRARISVELVRHEFLFGGNIFMFDRFGTAHENDLYKNRFREIFNYATTGFYWRWYEPEPGKPNYAYTDKVVDWCVQNHIRLKGHPLLWACDAGTPPWSKELPPEPIQKQRVSDIMSRYDGRIGYWEVVNEPAHESGLTIDAPYRWAREASPGSHLIVNDYYVMANGCPSFFTLLRHSLSNGVPFDGIGIQAHEPQNMRFPLDRVWNVLDQYATLGKPIHITEFCPTSSGLQITGSRVNEKWDEASQADYAVKFYTVCFAHPAVTAITWWDLCDVGSWREGGGLLRKDLTPKPAYTAT